MTEGSLREASSTTCSRDKVVCARALRLKSVTSKKAERESVFGANERKEEGEGMAHSINTERTDSAAW